MCFKGPKLCFDFNTLLLPGIDDLQLTSSLSKCFSDKLKSKNLDLPQLQGSCKRHQMAAVNFQEVLRILPKRLNGMLNLMCKKLRLFLFIVQLILHHYCILYVHQGYVVQAYVTQLINFCFMPQKIKLKKYKEILEIFDGICWSALHLDIIIVYVH